MSKMEKIALITIALVSYFCELNTFDELLKTLYITFSSVTFVSAIAIYTAQNLKLPASQLDWPPTFIRFYKGFVMLLLPSYSLKYIFVPILRALIDYENHLAEKLIHVLGIGSRKHLLVLFLKCDQLHVLQELVLSLYIFYSVVHATGLVKELKRSLKSILPPPCSDTPVATLTNIGAEEVEEEKPIERRRRSQPKRTPKTRL